MDMMTLRRRLMQNVAPLQEYTATGNPASFLTDIAKPLKSFVVPFESESGISGLTAYRTGKNLLHITLESGSSSGMEWTVASDGVITVGGTPTGVVQFTCGVVQLPTSGKVTVSGGYVAVSNVTWAQCIIKDENGTSVGSVGNSDVRSFTFDVADYPGAKTIDIRIKRKSNNVQCSGEIKLQCEIGTAATAFEPFVSFNSFPVVFPESVNDGVVDLISGELTVTSPESKTVQLDPVTMSTLKGTNVLWTDTNGNNTVKYLKRN